MITVYFNDLAINFTKKNTSDDFSSIHVSNSNDVNKFVKELNGGKFDFDIILNGYSTNKMVKDFCSSYKYIEAAGGVVTNNKSEYLLIKRFDIWDLPKGKVEQNETTHEAAIREVCEETGLVNVEVNDKLSNTYHIYKQKRNWFLKKTHWYLMETHDEQKLVPQLNESITDAVWMKKSDVTNALSKSYRSIFDTFGYLFAKNLP